MRERKVQVELTEKEVLLNSEAIYLATLCLSHPEWFNGDRGALEAIMGILTSPAEWTGYLSKMHSVCVLEQTNKGC